MAILDILKKKKTIKEEKAEKLTEKTKEIKEVKPQKPKEKRIGRAYKVLKTPHITEKATDLSNQNQYVFKIYSQSNKPEIKKAIEDLYGVNVLSVKIIRVPAKRRRLGRMKGWREGYKKAIVRIKQGQKIEVLPR